MKKKILLGLVAAVIAVGGVAAMSAYEAHVINVTAHIENALAVSTDAIKFGTVFPQEMVTEDFTVSLSSSFLGAERVDDVQYVIKQKPKCICTEEGVMLGKCAEGEYAPIDYATHECPVYFEGMLSLCPFLSKMDADPEDDNDTSHPSYYDDKDTSDPSDDSCAAIWRYDNTLAFSSGGWAGWSCPADYQVVGGGVLGNATVNISQPAKPGVGIYPNYPHYNYTPPEEGWVVQNNDDNEVISYYVECLPVVPDATGLLTKKGGDTIDIWTVDLKVPPVAGTVGQDWPAGCPTVPENDLDYGCDLWIEVTNVSEVE